jgi:hypothetical protein
MDLAREMGGRDGDEDGARNPAQPPPKKRKPSLFNPLGGIPNIGGLTP